MQGLRGRARGWRDRWVDQTLLQVERARADLVAGRADVLLMGESSCLSWAHGDHDRTLVPELLAQRTGARVTTVLGAGFDARMYDSVLRVLAMLPQRPRAVVLAINVRTNTARHVTDHPLHGHARTRAALARISPPVRHVRALGNGGSRMSDREVAAFRALPVVTRWQGSPTIGGYLERLEGQGPPPWPPAVERIRFDYFHGPLVDSDNPGLEALATAGRRLAEYGAPAVAFWAQPPVERGELHYPGEFAGHVHGNLALVESALRRHTSALPALVRPELQLADFQDARNGTEHYAHAGRVKVADAIAEELSRHV